MKIHLVKSWVITHSDRACDLVYDQMRALDLFGKPNAVELRLAIQQRVCVLDRPDYNPAEDGDKCYLCEE